MVEINGNGKTLGRLDQSISDIREDIKEINNKIDKLGDKLDRNTEELKKWCMEHDKNNVTDLAAVRSDLDKVKGNREGISKIWVAIVSGISGILGAALGIGGLVILEFVKGYLK